MLLYEPFDLEKGWQQIPFVLCYMSDCSSLLYFIHDFQNMRTLAVLIGSVRLLPP